MQMVTGLEGSIMECHPSGSLLPAAAFHYADLAWMSEFTGTKLFISTAAMMSTAT